MQPTKGLFEKNFGYGEVIIKVNGENHSFPNMRDVDKFISVVEGRSSSTKNNQSSETAKNTLSASQYEQQHPEIPRYENIELEDFVVLFPYLPNLVQDALTRTIVPREALRQKYKTEIGLFVKKNDDLGPGQIRKSPIDGKIVGRGSEVDWWIPNLNTIVDKAQNHALDDVAWIAVRPRVGQNADCSLYNQGVRKWLENFIVCNRVMGEKPSPLGEDFK